MSLTHSVSTCCCKMAFFFFLNPTASELPLTVKHEESADANFKSSVFCYWKCWINHVYYTLPSVVYSGEDKRALHGRPPRTTCQLIPIDSFIIDQAVTPLVPTGKNDRGQTSNYKSLETSSRRNRYAVPSNQFRIIN
ncbi:hypothetical protein MPH_07699 [Macrophomina phaseolina MS6]|uniref:Secreted protein n=1 Tax=Macrophomina phaseolina (strain MS6) TaxID=1126212 RepID=K2RQR9_MACPH|nr:hypothetical protein MPH_07699 [Macrophomina phaseolina MS6]